MYVAAKRQLPNVRTLNTLLRGCLWSAASVDANGVVCGGVVTSEKVWKLYQEKHESSDKESQNFDVSSYEYSITLLCQALRTKEAENRINESTVVTAHLPYGPALKLKGKKMAGFPKNSR